MSGRTALVFVTFLELDVALSLKPHGQRFPRGGLLSSSDAALTATFLATATVAFAQTAVPDAPTDIAVYIYSSQKLEVRWSSSDAASTTSFKVPWKSSSQQGYRIWRQAGEVVVQ